jgi:hypothetical protein
MTLGFVGASPTDDEAAAILAVLLARESEPMETPRTPAWMLAHRFPDLDLDEVRTLRITGNVR